VLRFCGLIDDLTLNYTAVASCIMQKEARPNITAEVKEYVKLFLSSYSKLDIAVTDGYLIENKEVETLARSHFDPKWNTAGNFPSIYHLPSEILVW
jgi:hypothetical protein